jgi:hypothetical protein
MFGPPTDKSFDANDRVVMTWIHSAAQAKGTSFIPFAGPFVGGTNVQVQKLIVICRKRRPRCELHHERITPERKYGQGLKRWRDV